MNRKLERLYNTANAEFWLQLDNGLSERFGEMLREYCEDQNEESIASIVKDYKEWREWHPEAQ